MRSCRRPAIPIINIGRRKSRQENHGKYYLYYAMGGVEPEHFVLRVGISDQPQGPFYRQRSDFDGLAESNRFTIDP